MKEHKRCLQKESPTKRAKESNKYKKGRNQAKDSLDDYQKP